MPAVTFLEKLWEGMDEMMESHRLELDKETYLVFSCKRNEPNIADCYKRDFILDRDAEMLWLIIEDNCADDQCLQIRLKSDMSVRFEYTAQTTLEEEIQQCTDEFQKHLDTIFPPSLDMSEEIESPMSRRY